MDKFNPAYYKIGGCEAINIAEWLPYNRGSAIKYLVRAGTKEGESEIDDLKKALWFLEREIKRLEG